VQQRPDPDGRAVASVDQGVFGERLGRNARYAAIGNVVAQE
jgi:hypothetical protein